MMTSIAGHKHTWGVAGKGAPIAPIIIWAAHEGDLKGEPLLSHLFVDQADGRQPDVIVQAVEAQCEGLQVISLTPADVCCSMSVFRAGGGQLWI